MAAARATIARLTAGDNVKRKIYECRHCRCWHTAHDRLRDYDVLAAYR